MKTKNKSGVVILLILSIVTFFVVFTVVRPAIIKSKSDNMIKYLKSEGYSNIKMIDTNGWTGDATFSTNKGNVVVRFSKNGCFQIVY